MKECAFCTYSGKLTREHIFAKWVRDLFPGHQDAFYIGGQSNRNERFTTDAIDWKAKVVCKECNETWMSGIEANLAKPALTPFVTGNIDIPITKEIARSIAIYAFKTAVVQNHADHKNNPFFSARLRHAFKKNRSIPKDVSIWVCGIKHNLPKIQVMTAYYKGRLSPTYSLNMYVFTCGIGNLVIQAVSVKQIGKTALRPLAGYENIGIPVWPSIFSGQTWPGRYVLDGDGGQFEGFAKRWARIKPTTDVYL